VQISDEDIFKLMQSIRDDLTALNATVDHRFNTLERELYGYRVTVRVFKWMGALVLAIITLRFGDIKNLF
jgi:hypothetical protein